MVSPHASLALRWLAPAALALLLLGQAADSQARTKRRAQAAPVRVAEPVEQPDYSAREDIQRFILEMVEKHRFDQAELTRLFGQVRYSDIIVRLMTPGVPGAGGSRRSWLSYRDRMLDPLRLREGARFWRENEDVVRRASEQYGVPEEIIVSIIGVETIYGRITGDFRVIDALTVLTFDYTRRADFFRGELEQMLLFARENDLDVLSLRGSFAGAIGLPQFMPSSIRRYAVDFDGDGRIDLRRSPSDAIGSVARFLAEHGWQRGQATHYTMRHDDEARLMPLIQTGIQPTYTRADLREFGVVADPALADGLKVALIDLPNADNPTSYYLGTANFYVITRYNRSSFYAMAVIELARALREQRGAFGARTTTASTSVPASVKPVSATAADSIAGRRGNIGASVGTDRAGNGDGAAQVSVTPIRSDGKSVEAPLTVTPVSDSAEPTAGAATAAPANDAAAPANATAANAVTAPAPAPVLIAPQPLKIEPQSVTNEPKAVPPVMD